MFILYNFNIIFVLNRLHRFQLISYDSLVFTLILDADDCMALAELPVLFKEKTELLLIKDENAEQPMGIKFKKNIMTMDTESFIVYAEGTEVFKCDSFFEAYTGLLACIYVMNLAYPKGLEKTLLFVQNILIGLKDNAEKNSIDKRIVNVLLLINAELKKQ